jgi:hypothetical protein
MNWKKTFLGASLSLIALLSVAYLLHANEKALRSIFTEEHPLFIIHARSARIEMDTPSRGKLLMKSVSESVAYFSNNPTKKGGTVSIEDFIEDWVKDGERFEKNPPVAALVFFSTNIENFGQRHYSELTLLIKGIHLYGTHDILGIEFELLNPEDQEIYTGRLLEPTIFIE